MFPVGSRRFAVLQQPRTSALHTLLTVRVVQAQRTSANLTKLTSTERARCVGCLCTRSGWLKHLEPQRTYTLLTITELARCVGCLCTRAGWFKHSEPHRTYTLLTSTELARCVGCLCTRAGWFKHSEPPRSRLYGCDWSSTK